MIGASREHSESMAALLEVVLSLWELARPWSFWPIWEAVGRALLPALVALGLWRRLALSRSVALIYCLAALATRSEPASLT